MCLEELLALVVWASNSTRGRGGIAPIQSAAGMVPRDPLSLHLKDELTASQASNGDQFLHCPALRRRGGNMFPDG